MPWNGSGTYVLPSNSLSPTASSGTTIVSADFNELTNDLETAISNCLTGDGTNHVVTVDLPMSTNKHTGVGDAAALTDYASANQVVDNTLSYCVTPSAVGTDAYAVSLPVSPGVYAAGNRFQFIPEVVNTGACTVDFNSIGVKNIKMADATDPYDGAIQADVPCDVMYDGTSMILMNPYFAGASTTASAAELNYNDITTLGTTQASKVLTADGSAAIDNSAATWTDLGAVTTTDINGGTVDGAIIGGAAPAAITGTTIDGTVISASTSIATAAGATVTEFSTDGNMTNAAAVPVETAVAIAIAAAVTASSLGVGQTWTLPTRALSTIYQNTTGKPIQVIVSVDSVPLGGTSIFYCDAASTPITTVSEFQGRSAGDTNAIHSVIVPDDFYYRCIASTSSLREWAELS